MNQSAIEIRDLCFSYPDGHAALHGISLELAAGEAVGLVGGNGAGKSTLLLLLIGCLAASSGRIAVGGLAMERSTVARIRRATGMVFQDPDDQLFMPTVFDDVAFGPLNHGLDPVAVEARVAAALTEVGMEHLRDRPPHKLSGGEKRSIALATVLASDPDILIMDEPSSNLDPRARRRLIRWLQKSSHTRLIATHDLELVVETCSRVIVLDGGELVAAGPVRSILGNADLMDRHGLETPHILQHHHPHH
jgi:cobalt/nickel transport system ATP-binding protein